MKPEGERIAVVETEQKIIKKTLETVTDKLDKIVDRFDTMLTKHDLAMSELIKDELKAFDIRLEKIEKQTEITRFYHEHPKLAFLAFAGLYLFAISDVRDFFIRLIF